MTCKEVRMVGVCSKSQGKRYMGYDLRERGREFDVFGLLSISLRLPSASALLSTSDSLI